MSLEQFSESVLSRTSSAPSQRGFKTLDACVEHGVSLALRHAIEFAFVLVAKTEVFHGSSPRRRLAEPAAKRCAGSSISSLERVFRGRSGQGVYLLSPGPCS